MKRIFLALDLDPDARAYLQGLGGIVPGARLVPAEQFHLTVRFIGEVEGTLFRTLRDQLGMLQTPPVTLSIKGVGCFPPRGKPRIIWAGIEADHGLTLLRNRVNRLLRAAGVEPEPRKFHAHVTLARLKNSSPGRVAEFLGRNSLLSYPSFTVDQLTLFSSQLTPKGPLYSVEAEYPLLAES